MKIAIIANNTFSLIHLRFEMILDFLSKGHNLVIYVPDNEYIDQLNDLNNVKCVELHYNRTGTNPVNDFKLIRTYRKHIRNDKPDIVFAYNLKPVIYGIYAAHKEGIKELFAMIPGAGFVFSGENIKAKIIQLLIRSMYQKSLRLCKKVFFQNPDDLGEFVSGGMLQKKQCVQINGSGVNLERFLNYPLPNKPVFLFIARLLRVKGIIEYCEAAKKIHQKYPNIEFHVVGGYDENPTSINKNELDRYISQNVILYQGQVKDVRPYIRNASIFVLPSYHREGVPHVILEAMSMGRSILTTTAIGCRETVKEGINGFMIPPKDVEALVEKMIWFIEHYDKVSQMGKESYLYCKEKFDVNRVNKIIVKSMEL
ncbi:glycosyltransferase family 4 protein [Sporolactobacillus laevolacticus]|uniref:glycosyltransferase family 4 protein n=1 Tax=Sporolactobacillus laevolacticus TaxID=33018 RepID=UPI0025B35E81|nr:glycosyltransferase family 4 protein [Sporolactobacillus laevolacticus]MDN3954744.1 glycosyltransferase family 4 protein [Sporolactobacillus laevolacticus]